MGGPGCAIARGPADEVSGVIAQTIMMTTILAGAPVAAEDQM